MKHVGDDKLNERILLNQEKITEMMDEKAKIYKKLLEATERATYLGIMASDTNTMLDSPRRKWMEMMQRRIIEKDLFVLPCSSNDV